MSGFDFTSFKRHASAALTAFGGIEVGLAKAGLPPLLRHLVKLRASQINGCSFCVAMHTREAREDGETQERLDQLVIWREADCYSSAERAALAWTEALTRLDDSSSGLDALRARLQMHFGEAEIVALTTQIAMINVWNRLQVAAHGRRDEAEIRVAA